MYTHTADEVPAASPATSYSHIATTPWGTAHPDFDEDGQSLRAQWTEAEIDYIDHWYRTINVDGNTNLLASRCLKWLQACPDAYPIFHEIHTLNSRRLLAGINKYRGR